jgi:hypothetical protein
MPQLVTNKSITADILTAGGFPFINQDQLAQNLRSSKPHPDNLTEILDRGQELVFAADGMPILGTTANGYDNAPPEYARRFAAYPRADSPSRVQASNEEGAKINAGAFEHLSDLYGATVGLVGSLAVAKRATLGITETTTRTLTAPEALDVMDAAIAMQSFMRYRKDGRSPKGKLQPEVALLHRTMSGVRMSLLSLFVHDNPHGFPRVTGWQDQPLTSNLWATAVEKSGLLVSEGPRAYPGHPSQKEVCPAPARMIQHVLEVIVDTPDKAKDQVDIEKVYGTTGAVLLEYGQAIADLSRARIKKSKIHNTAGDQILTHVDRHRTLTVTQLSAIRQRYLPALREAACDVNQERDQAFARALQCLGYNPKTFKAAPYSF